MVSMNSVRRFPELSARWRKMMIADAPLCDYTTMRVGGPSQWLINVSSSQDLIELIHELRRRGMKWRLLGGGSNVVMDDDGLDGVLVVFRQDKQAIRCDGETLVAEGGAPFSELAMCSVQAGLTGCEFCAGIPGTLGGAIYGNAGAFGEQIGDVLRSITLLKPDGRVVTVSPSMLGFSYRHSVLKTSGDIILSATLALKTGNKHASQARIDDIMALRKSKHPDIRVTPCAGSFFRNLEPTSAASRRQAAGAFLEQVGAKQMSVGAAAVYPRHANIIINAGGARCSEIVALAKQMRAAVQTRFGFGLVREVAIWTNENLDDLPDM
jgi:UDP-N-acetylmuramate dehydrogenase